MGSEAETLEERLKSFHGQLQTECGIFKRIVYKNKNQHRRCSYFQYLLKVRRDLKLLQSAKLDEILGSCFNVINGKRPKQKINLLESLKRKKCDSEKHNFMERLLGAARLLSQMVEPMLKAAIEISKLLARSFFMGFSVTVLALLARLRVLVQQVFLDVVAVFNMVSSLSQQKHSVKINQDGIEVFREFYPTIRDCVVLDCVWKVDKFVLHEKLCKGEAKSQDGDLIGEVSLEAPVVRYESLESFLGDDEPGATADGKVEDGPAPAHNTETTDSSAALSTDQIERETPNDGCTINGDGLATIQTPSSKNFPSEVAFPSHTSSTPLNHSASLPSTETPLNHSASLPSTENDGDSSATIQTLGKNLSAEGAFPGAGSLSIGSNPLKRKLGAKGKVAFVSVKKPAPLRENESSVHLKEAEKKSGESDDPFFSLLAGGNFKDSLF